MLRFQCHSLTGPRGMKLFNSLRGWIVSAATSLAPLPPPKVRPGSRGFPSFFTTTKPDPTPASGGKRCRGARCDSRLGADLGGVFPFRVSQLGGEVLCRCADHGHDQCRRAACRGSGKRASAMNRLRLMILCGRSARHLHVANTLCRAGEALAIVQETGGEWDLKKTLKKMRPDNLFRKGWRWLRDRRRYTGNPEAKFFFPDGQDRTRLNSSH